MREWICCLLSRSISMTGVAMVLVLLSPLFTKWYTAKARYYAWLIVLVGFLALWELQIGNETGFFILPEEAYVFFDREEFENEKKNLWFENHQKIGNGSVWTEMEPSLEFQGMEEKEPQKAKQKAETSSSEIKQQRDSVGNGNKKKEEADSSVSVSGEDMSLKKSKRISSTVILFFLWLCGFLGVIFYQAGKHIRFIRLVKRWSSPYMQIMVDGKRHGSGRSQTEEETGFCKKEVPVRICSVVANPMLTGLVSPMILLPEKVYDEEELGFILKHELVHYRRKDLWYKLLMLIVRAVHWFNPFLHEIFRQINQECEISCDEEVLLQAGMEERLFYTETVIGMIRHGKGLQSRLSALFYGREHDMKKRIYAIMETKKKKAGIAVLAVALAGTAIAGTVGIVSAQKEVTGAAELETGRSENVTGSSLKQEMMEKSPEEDSADEDNGAVLENVLNEEMDEDSTEIVNIKKTQEKNSDSGMEMKERKENQDADNDKKETSDKKNNVEEKEKKNTAKEDKEKTAENIDEENNAGKEKNAESSKKENTEENDSRIKEDQKTEKNYDDADKKKESSNETEEEADEEEEGTVDLSDMEEDVISLSSTVSYDFDCAKVTEEQYWEMITEQGLIRVADIGKNISSINYIKEDKNGIQHDIGVELVVTERSKGIISIDDQGNEVYEMDSIGFRAELDRILAEKSDELMGMDYVDLEEYLHKWEELERQAAAEMEQWANEHMADSNCEIPNITFHNLWFS